MIELLAIPLGAASRRLVGWGPVDRKVGQVVAAIACVLAMWGHEPWAIVLCAVAVPLAYGLPLHGETINRPVLMGLRNFAFTLSLAIVLYLVFQIEAWWYAPAGLFVGLGYGLAKRYAPKGPEGGVYDGWNSAAEFSLGAVLCGGLILI